MLSFVWLLYVCTGQSLVLDTACVYHAGVNYARFDQFDKAKLLLEEALSLNYNYSRTSRLLADILL